MNADSIRLIAAITPAIPPDWWDRRWDVAWYVSRCEMAGWCNTNDMRRMCAERYMAGKRKVSPPGTERRKKAERERRRFKAPPELIQAVKQAASTPVAEQYRDGHEKALNALVGMVLRQHKVDAAIVKQMLVSEVSQH